MSETVVALARRTALTATGAAAVAVVTLVCYRTRVDLATAIPAYFLVVVGQALAGDFYAATIISLLSVGCLDFFFTDPQFSLYVSSPRQIVALVAFIFTATIITQLVYRQRKEANASKLQKTQLARLYDLTQQLLVLKAETVMSDKFVEPFRSLFGVAAICAFDADAAEIHIAGTSERRLDTRTREAYIRGCDLDDPASNVFVRCLRIGSTGRMTGAVGLEGLCLSSGDDAQSRETSGQLAILTAILVQRNKAFREASRAAAAAQAETYRSAVLDALAHEFKTPLTTILTAAGAIRDSGSLGSEQQEMAATVENEAARLTRMTSRLLRTARLDREEIKPRFDLVNIGSLAAAVARQYADGSPDRHLSYLESSDVEVMADPGLLRLALSQLIENAYKYSLPDSTIAIEIESAGEQTAIKVSNDGSSIPYGERERIFERFYRGTNATHATSGSGLGLYVARKIAIAHGGALELENQGRSTNRVTFCLRIPTGKEASHHVLTT